MRHTTEIKEKQAAAKGHETDHVPGTEHHKEKDPGTGYYEGRDPGTEHLKGHINISHHPAPNGTKP